MVDGVDIGVNKERSNEAISPEIDTMSEIFYSKDYFLEKKLISEERLKTEAG